ncbi:MAG TPA: glycine--tRNA ligase subunit beta [Acidobacteriota bacterium]|nr:glycine--tRNA ligase subunit beta [Acidobacteriota bacterium]
MNIAFQGSAGASTEIMPQAEAMAQSRRLESHQGNEFVLEIGTEEVPAAMMPDALAALAEKFADAMREARLQHAPLETFCTPRRLILYCPLVAERQPDITAQVTGPSRKVAFDLNGKPTRALEGFLQKNQIGIDQLEIATTPRGEYVSFRRQIEGRPALEVLAELLSPLIFSIPFPKSMHWRTHQERFIRPIHYVVALLAGKVIPFEVAGVRSGRSTVGHLILAPEVFSVSSFAELKSKLADHFVLIDPEERRKMITDGLAAVLPEGLQALHDAGLLDEVVHLIEYPQVVLGEFDGEFLKLPEEILITVLKRHQKYFAVTDRKGKIQPYFLTVLNTATISTEKIRKGHQRVLRARLEDAAFYRDFDRRKKLEERIELLEHVLFEKKLGSYGDKVRRLDLLAQLLAEATSLTELNDLHTAAQLCKTDLTTEMVREFTELQGIVGGLYARAENYPESVWKAIYQHYRPVSQDDAIPDSRIGRLLSLADKTDTLCGSFGIGIVPTGSSDPFSLRRLCQGIVRITIEAPLSFSLLALLNRSLDLFGDRITRKRDEVLKDLFQFIDARVRHLFTERGLRYDVINAVVETGYNNLLDLYYRAEAVQTVRQEPDFEAIAVSFKRINNILAGHSGDSQRVEDELLKEPAERDLYREVTTVGPKIQTKISEGKYYDALKMMATMRPQLDLFFDKVLVMADDPKLRQNRLRLLQTISRLFRQVGDLSQIVVE